MKKYIAIVVILILAGVVYWQGKKTEAPKFVSESASSTTSGWQTYKNEQYGFEFQYPKEWKTSDIFQNSYSALGNFEKQIVLVRADLEEKIKRSIIPDSDNGPVAAGDRALFFEPASKTRIEEIFAREKAFGFNFQRIRSSENWSVYKITARNDFTSGSYQIVIIQNSAGNGVVFETLYNGPTPKGELKTLLDDIADQFVPAISWQTYNKKDYANIQFSYPSDWVVRPIESTYGVNGSIYIAGLSLFSLDTRFESSPNGLIQIGGKGISSCLDVPRAVKCLGGGKSDGKPVVYTNSQDPEVLKVITKIFDSITTK
jgi:hypothetical protein